MNLASDNTEIIESTPETTLTVRHPYYISSLFQTKNNHVHEQTYPQSTRNHESWSIPTYNIQSISDCFVLGLFLMHPWPFQTKDSHVHEVRNHRHHNVYWISVRKEEKRKKKLQLWRSTVIKISQSNLNERFFMSKESNSETFTILASFPSIFLTSLFSQSGNTQTKKWLWSRVHEHDNLRCNAL